MNQSLVVLGRQPALGLAELESLYGANSLHPISQQIAILDRPHTDIKKAGRSVRVLPNTGLELNSPQSMHNQPAGPTGLELIIVKDGNATIIAQATNTQDINTYAARDQARPKRDAR